jgi:hypothetical protein
VVLEAICGMCRWCHQGSLTAELNRAINLTWLGFCVLHVSDCLNSFTRQIVIEVDKYSSSVEVAFPIAYIFQVPLEQFLQYPSPKPC